MESVLFNDTLFGEIMRHAALSPRLRMNYNLYCSLDAGAQCLLNVLLPGTVLPIHRHRHTAETYVVLRGKLNLLFYNDKKMLASYTLGWGR